MASGTIQIIPKLYFRRVQISSQETADLTFSDNLAIVFCKRGNTGYIAMLDYWSVTVTTIFASQSEDPTITKSANSHDFSIKNNRSSGALMVYVISAM